MIITEIGIVAGEIWHYLDQHGEVSLPQLLEGLGNRKEVILMSLGWLAREGHVLVRYEKNEYRVNLR
ncbi:MAG: hypothetical protein GF333_02695 [Candidatus Omnitrophica bacterium]|nr:hypothetical protein [Candidatus Omnitrophota bacterium]